MMRIALTTLGCKANWADAEGIAQQLASFGHEIVAFDAMADVYIVNTCTVTAVASSQSRQLLRRARRQSPKALVVATGCLGETEVVLLRQMPEVDEVFGTKDREALIARLTSSTDAQAEQPSPDGAFRITPRKAQSRARAFVKIQEGCDRACAYCIIPQARGKARSMAMDEIETVCRALAVHHREIILTGIDIGQYGKGLSEGSSLVTLLERLTAVPGMPRLRLSSLDPLRITEELVQEMANGGICRHIHLSIQSASDAVLHAMGRPYRAQDVRDAVWRLHEAIPQIAITGDVIAGFPGETEADHAEVVASLRELPLSGLHVFPFSARHGTRAAAMLSQVPKTVREERASDLRMMATKKREGYLARLIDQCFDVIVISREPNAEGSVIGVTDTAVEVELPAEGAAYGSLRQVRIVRTQGLKVQGLWE